MRAFEFDQVVVGAPFGGGKLVANGGACVINPTLARIGIKKLAGLSEDRIRLAAQHTFVVINPCEPLLGHLITYAEVSRQTIHIALGDLHALVDRTTVSGAPGAVIRDGIGICTHVLAGCVIRSPRQT